MKAVMVCPQIEHLHAVNRHDGVHFWPNGVITGMTEFVREDEKLKELGIVNMCMDRAQTVEFASAFGENMTIKALTLGEIDAILLRGFSRRRFRKNTL
jgi:hypothetical protein